MRWWTGYDQGNNPDQISIFDLEEEFGLINIYQ